MVVIFPLDLFILFSPLTYLYDSSKVLCKFNADTITGVEKLREPQEPPPLNAKFPAKTCHPVVSCELAHLGPPATSGDGFPSHTMINE